VECLQDIEITKHLPWFSSSTSRQKRGNQKLEVIGYLSEPLLIVNFWLLIDQTQQGHTTSPCDDLRIWFQNRDDQWTLSEWRRVASDILTYFRGQNGDSARSGTVGLSSDHNIAICTQPTVGSMTTIITDRRNVIGFSSGSQTFAEPADAAGPSAPQLTRESRWIKSLAAEENPPFIAIPTVCCWLARWDRSSKSTSVIHKLDRMSMGQNDSSFLMQNKLGNITFIYGIIYQKSNRISSRVFIYLSNDRKLLLSLPVDLPEWPRGNPRKIAIIHHRHGYK
jgi:hypothetical protein